MFEMSSLLTLSSSAVIVWIQSQALQQAVDVWGFNKGRSNLGGTVLVRDNRVRLSSPVPRLGFDGKRQRYKCRKWYSLRGQCTCIWLRTSLLKPLFSKICNIQYQRSASKFSCEKCTCTSCPCCRRPKPAASPAMPAPAMRILKDGGLSDMACRTGERKGRNHDIGK